MSEELLQRGLLENPDKIGRWNFYNIGNTTVKSLKEHDIIRNVDYGTLEKKKVDGILVQQKNVIAIIEYKKPSEFKTTKQKEKAIQQELEIARKLKAHIYIATDTKEAVWINVLTGNIIKDEENKAIKILFDKNNDKLPILIEKIISSINEKNDTIKPKKMVNPTDLAKQIWQDIWSVSGATPENCLYTFVELFIFKYLSDLGVLKGRHSFDNLLDSYKTNTPDEVLEDYARTIRKKIKALFPENTVDKTTIINGTIFVSKDQNVVEGYSTVFKKVLEKFKNYGKLENIDYDFKSQLFESFLKESISKKNWGQFFTPLKVVKAVVNMAKDDIKTGIKICDPACGVGKFLLEPIKKNLQDFYKTDKNNLVKNITICGYDKGFDKDEQKTIILAKANMLIYFSDLIKENSALTKKFAELFNESFILKTNSILGTLSEPIKNEYDLILTNPPYVTSGSSNLKEEIKKSGLENDYKISAMGVEGLFMEWIINALKPNGKAFIIVPDGIFNRQNDKNLRSAILNDCFIDAVISLPLNTFFTTNKKTYILALTKKNNKADKQTDPVFSYLVSEIGESRDVYRFDIEQNDLSEAVELYSFFKGNKSGFKKINKDNRCKILPIDFFEKNVDKSWIIDKEWTEEERIELGIIEKKDKISLQDFSMLVNDMASTMSGYVENINEIAEKKNPNIVLKNFKVTDLFTLERGKGLYTKTYCNNNTGIYPVYSGNTTEKFAEINSYDYDGAHLSWAIDGLAGYIMHTNSKFSATNHRGVLIPKVDNLNLKYIKIAAEPIFRKNIKGRRGENGENEYTTLPPFMIENLEIQMPVDNNGNLCLKSQQEIVDKVGFIEEIKEKIRDYRVQLQNFHVDIPDDYAYSTKYLAEIFDFQDGYAFPSSAYTTKDTDIKLIRIQDLNDKSRTKTVCISQNFVFPNKEKYLINSGDYLLSLSGTLGLFIKWHGKQSYLNQRISKVSIKDEFKNKFIDGYEEILMQQVSEELKSMGKGANNNLAKRDILNIELKIPIDDQGNFDVKIQEEIAAKYKKIGEIKKNLCVELDKLFDVQIDFN